MHKTLTLVAAALAAIAPAVLLSRRRMVTRK